jgi:hypothetical protein
MLLKNDSLEKIFDEKYSLIDYLPWGDYVDGFFVQVDGSIGRIWELRPAETELSSEVQMEDLSNIIAALISRIPSQLHCQLILLCDSEVETILSEYKTTGSGNDNEIVDTIINEKILHIQNSKDGFFEKSRDNFYPRRIRILLTIRYFPSWSRAKTKDKINGLFVNGNALRERLAQEWESHKKAIQKSCDYIESSLQSINLPFLSVDEKELIQTLYRLLNPRRAKNIPATRVNDEFIREQILFNAPQALGGKSAY